MSRGRLYATVQLTAWTGALVVVLRVLVAAGSDSLAVPFGSLDDLSDWVADTPPADMTVALLRLAALAAVGYLLAVTVVTVVASVARFRALAAAVDRISPEVVRRVAAGGSGIGLALGGLVASLPSPGMTSPPSGDAVASAPATPPGVTGASTATMARVPDATATMVQLTDDVTPASPVAATMTRVDQVPSTATMTRFDQPARPEATPSPAVTPTAFAPQPALHPTPPAPVVDPHAWVVEPGDSLWSIAEEVTAAPDGTTASRQVVTRYWRQLVEANRADLVDPGNADLLVPGQRLVVPPPPG